MFTKRIILAELRDILGFLLISLKNYGNIPREINNLFKKKVEDISKKSGINFKTPNNPFAYTVTAVKKYMPSGKFEEIKEFTYNVLLDFLSKEGKNFFNAFENSVKNKQNKQIPIEDTYFSSYFYKSLQNSVFNYTKKKNTRLKTEEPFDEDRTQKIEEPIKEDVLKPFIKKYYTEIENYIKNNQKNTELKEILLGMLEAFKSMSNAQEKLNEVLSERGLKKKKINTYVGMSKYLGYVKGMKKFQEMKSSHCSKYIGRYNGDLIKNLINFSKETNNQYLLDYLKGKSRQAPKEMQKKLKKELSAKVASIFDQLLIKFEDILYV